MPCLTPCRVPVWVLPVLGPWPLLPPSLAHGSFRHSTLSTLSSLIHSSSNKARSYFRLPLPRELQQSKNKEMNRSPFLPNSDDTTEQPALDEQPPGVDPQVDQQYDPWSQNFAGGPPPIGPRFQPTAGFIRRPAGWTPVQAGNGVSTPQGSSSPLSATLFGYDISRTIGPVGDAPPPGSGSPVTYEPGGCQGVGAINHPPPVGVQVQARPSVGNATSVQHTPVQFGTLGQVPSSAQPQMW
jgi:hypothetical protein